MFFTRRRASAYCWNYCCQGLGASVSRFPHLKRGQGDNNELCRAVKAFRILSANGWALGPYELWLLFLSEITVSTEQTGRYFSGIFIRTLLWYLVLGQWSQWVGSVLVCQNQSLDKGADPYIQEWPIGIDSGYVGAVLIQVKGRDPHLSVILVIVTNITEKARWMPDVAQSSCIY